MVSAGTIWLLQIAGRAPKALPGDCEGVPEQIGDDLVVLKIDPATFFHAERYGGRSPLDRCKLKGDIDSILRAYKGLITLGIDLDLSPVGDGDQDLCGFQILNMLRDKRQDPLDNEFRAVLIWPILPFEQSGARRWFDIVNSRGIRLADPRFEVEFGMVRAYRDSTDQCPSLGVAVREAQNHKSFCHCKVESLSHDPVNPELRQIAFESIAFSPTVRYLVDDAGYHATLDRQIECTKSSKVRRVLLGAGYTQDDVRLTPVGPLSGVEIHAAIAAKEGPREYGWAGFIIDVIVGVSFGALAHKLWLRYLMQRLGLQQPVSKRDRSAVTSMPPRELAWLWLALLVFATASIVIALAFFSGLASHLLSVWIRPIPILLGMACDALVTGSVQSTIHAREHGLISAPDLPQRALRWWHQMPVQVPLLIWCFVVGLSLVRILEHMH